MATRKKQRVSNYLPCPEPYLMLPHKLILSEEFNSLNQASIRLYLFLLTRWSRDKEKIRNPIIFTYEELHKLTGWHPQTISRSLKELEDKDFISIIHGGKNNPSKYEITYKWLTN